MGRRSLVAVGYLLIQIERLSEIVVGPTAHRLDRRGGPSVGGDDNHRQIVQGRTKVAKHLETIAAGHLEVKQHGIRIVGLDFRQRLIAISRIQCSVSLGLEQQDEIAPDRAIVVGYEHCASGVGRQVAEDLHQGGRSHFDLGERVIELELHSNTLRFGRYRSQTGCFRDDGIQVARGMIVSVSPREMKQPRHDLFEPVNLVVEIYKRLGVRPDTVLPELHRRADACKRVADLVGHTGQQLAEGGKPLRPPQLGLQPRPRVAELCSCFAMGPTLSDP